jgi:hypothetical protein
MRNTFLTLIVLLTTIASYAQKDIEPRMIGTTFINVHKIDKPQGSPYLQKMFTPAKVKTIAQNSNMRYNVFTDEMEFITTKGDTLILDKIEDFANITFNGTNKKYVLTPYTNTKGKLTYGYLIELYEKNNIVLFQKENINFYEGKKAKTSLEKDMPSRYAKTDDSFFLKVKDMTSEFPGGKKDLVKLFPDKKTDIETWLKANKVSFSDRADMVKIVDFLATL